MEKEAQKPQIAPPRIRNIGKVLRELGIGPETPNQAHLPTYKVFLTEEKYTPSEAMAKVENIATLMDVIRDEDFHERYLNAKIHSFYISSKDIPLELINALKSLGLSDDNVRVRINHEEGTLNPISKEKYDILNPNERGIMSIGVLKGIREGGLLCIVFNSISWWVSNPVDHGDIGSFCPAAFTEPTD